MANTKSVKELEALISLLDEDNKDLLAQIVDSILLYGKKAVPYLENAYEYALNEDVQRKIENLTHTIQFRALQKDLKKWHKLGAHNLLSGAGLVARFMYPNLEIKSLKSEIEKIKKDIWLELSDDLTPLEKVRVINHILFDVYLFKANKGDYYAPNNSFINKVLETKTGNPLSLGVVYILLAHSLNIPIFGVNLPEHFILAYTSEMNSDFNSFKDRNTVLFYINPFNNGIVFTRREIDAFIEKTKVQANETFYYPCSNIDIVKRMLANLINSYEKIGHPQKMNELSILMGILNE